MAERFLISRLSALGDTVCTLPVAVALKRRYPECEITWAVDPRFAAVVECCSAIDHVVRVKPSLKAIPKWEGEFDAALDMQGLLKSAVSIWRAKAKQKVGYHWQREGSRFFSSPVLPDPTSFHVVDQYLDVARALGADMETAAFLLKPKEDDILSVRRLLKERGVFGRFVIMNAGAGWVSKRWPPEHFAKLADSIELPVVLIGGKAEADKAAAQEVIDKAHNKPFSLVGETSVGGLIALIRLCSAHIGGDTGSTHIAAAMDIPAVGLYSITKPARSCPYGQVQRCHYDSTALSCIQPEDVLKTVQEAIR